MLAKQGIGGTVSCTGIRFLSRVDDDVVYKPLEYIVLRSV